MLYYLFLYLDKVIDLPGAGLMRYITFRAGAAAILALILAFWIGPLIVRKLARQKIGEAAKIEAPSTHLHKAGTPTMGGLIILISSIIPAMLFLDVMNGYVILSLLTLIALGVVGFLDDYLKVIKKKPKGLVGRYKIIGQITVGFVLGGSIYFFPELFDASLAAIKSSTTVPFFKNMEFDFGVFYIPMVILVVTATSNAVNLTDGLDGLAAGTVAIVAIALAIIAYISGNVELSSYLTIPYLRGTGELAIFSAIIVGACMGFLWFNAYPAQVFMGDTGSLALGGIIAALSVLMKKELLLPLLGGVFLMETLSVIIQRVYFKYTKRKYGVGRRVFKMAPLHHHFELAGWQEPKIVTRFYIIGILLMIITLATFKVR